VESNGNQEAKPPYGGYHTFWNFIRQLAESPSPVPQVLDRSVMGSRGGSSRAELYIALRFFGLMDAEKKPTSSLHALAADPSKANLRALVEQRYAPVIALGLDSATPTQVDQALSGMGATPSTIGRTRTFFLNALSECGIEVGHHLRTARAPASPSARRKSKPRARTPEPTPEPPVNGDLPPLVKALVSKMPSEADGWDEGDVKQWLKLLPSAIAYDYGLDLSAITEES
jgi:hypothetical protein